MPFWVWFPTSLPGVVGSRALHALPWVLCWLAIICLGVSSWEEGRSNTSDWLRYLTLTSSSQSLNQNSISSTVSSCSSLEINSVVKCFTNRSFRALPWGSGGSLRPFIGFFRSSGDRSRYLGNYIISNFFRKTSD